MHNKQTLQATDIDNPLFWLQTAHYFNVHWHKHIDALSLDDQRLSRGDTDTLSPVMRELHETQSRCFLTQKTDALVHAMHTAYDHYLADNSYQNPLWLYLDKDETGHDGTGEFFRLTAQGNPKGGCHIPKDDVYRYLTPMQLVFFGITN